MSEKQGHCGAKLPFGYFKFPHQLQSAHLAHLPRFEPGISKTQNHHNSPSHPTLCLTKTAYHTICNNTTPAVYYPVYNILYNRPHSTPNACLSYLRCCCLERQSTWPWNRTSGLDTSIGPGIYIISLKLKDHTHKKNSDLSSTPSDVFSCEHKDGVYCLKKTACN